MIWSTSLRTLCVVACFCFAACGSTKVSDKAKRQSDRYYESASIAWFQEHDTLQAIRSLTRSIKSNPDNDHANYLLGIIRLGRGEYEKAEMHLKKAVELRKDGDPSILAGAKNNLGLLFIHVKRYDEAVALLKEASEEVLNHEPWLAMGNLAWAYIELREYDEAIKVLKRAMFDQPKYCVGLFRMGQAYYLKKDYALAEASLKQSIEIPESGCNSIQEAHQLLGMCYFRLGREAEAQKALSRCQNLNQTTQIGVACKEALAGF